MRSKLTILCLSLLAVFSGSAQAQYIYTFAGNGHGARTGTGFYSGDGGQAKVAELNSPAGVAYDGAGNIYIADKGNNVIRKVNTSGVISTYAGTGVAGFSGDRGPATAARLNNPYSVAVDIYGNVFIADYGNNAIRRVSTAGVITTYAGTTAVGYFGDMGAATAAKFNGPQGIAVDSSGNLYIADANNHAIRQIDPSGVITSIAGDGIAGHTGDGGLAVNARLNSPVAVAVNPYGELFIADYFNNVVRKINTSGVISTFAGTGSVGAFGDNGPAVSAQFHYPAGVAVFGFNNVYISDQGNSVVRMVNPAGIITTVAGSYTNGSIGDGGLANAAQLSAPKGIAVNSLNRLYIADYDNNTVRVVQSFTAVPCIAAPGAGLKVYPNPSNGAITIELPATTNPATLTLTDMAGRIMETRTIPAGNIQHTILDLNRIPTGTYIVTLNTGNNVYREQVKVW